MANMVRCPKIKSGPASHRTAFAGERRICLFAAPGGEVHFRTALAKVRWVLRASCEPKFTVAAFDWWSDPAVLGLNP